VKVRLGPRTSSSVAIVTRNLSHEHQRDGEFLDAFTADYFFAEPLLGHADEQNLLRNQMAKSPVGPPYSNRANRLECQTGVHGDFDPQRLSGALANPIELTSFVAAVLNRIDSVTGVGLNQEEQ